MADDQKRKQFIQNTFNTVAENYGQGASRFFHISGDMMAGLLPLMGDESVLDVCCGTGATALPLAKKLPKGHVTAVDFSSAMLAQASQSATALDLNNIAFQTGDMTQLPFAANHFDHACCAFGIFFVEDMVSALRHIAQTVKTGGHVLISSFCNDSFQPMTKFCLDRLRGYGVEIPEMLGWQRIAEAEQLQSLFTEAGLSEVNIEQRSVGYFIDLEGWWEVVWSAGFRGFVEQLGSQDKIEAFKQEHLAELTPLCTEQGLPLKIDVNFTLGMKKEP